MSQLAVVTIILTAAAMAAGLTISSQIWTSRNLTLRQRCVCLFPLCILNAVVFAAFLLALLRPEFFGPHLIRSTVRSWAFLSGTVMVLLGVYYVAFADEVAAAHEDMVHHKHWWMALYLSRRPHRNIYRTRAVILLVGGMYLCSNSLWL